MIQDEDLAYACCSFGIGRWCWVVWASDSDARAGAKPLAEGYEKTSEAAEKKAVELVGLHSKRLPGKWASGYKRGGAGQMAKDAKNDKPKSRLSRRADSPARGKDPGRPTFLYVASESDQAGSRGDAVIVMHRIVRQTSRKIYVDREPFQEEAWQDTEGGAPEASDTRVLAVDREVLRREGRFSHRGSNYYASKEKGIQGVNADLTARHAWCAALDVCFPCSAEVVKVAYRRLALEKHPDVGGNQVEFQAVDRAYREALAYFSSRDAAAKLV